MNSVKVRNAAALLLDAAMIVLVAIAVGWFFYGEGLKSGVGNMKSGGFSSLQFFTIDSNILAALCSLIALPFHIKALFSGKEETPVWALILYFAGTAAVTLTFMVVLLFLGPLRGYRLMYQGSCFELHLICPLIAIVNFIFFTRGLVFSKRQTLWGVIPAVIYGAVYLTNVIFRKTWADFYSFNIGGFWYISCAVLFAASYLFGLTLCALHNRAEGQKK